MRKKLTFLLTTIILVATLVSPVNAADNSASSQIITVSPPEAQALATYTSIDYAYCTLSIDYNGCASVYNRIVCDSNVDKIVISSYLQRYDGGWKTVKNWRQTTYASSASMSKYMFVSQGYSYRVKTYFYAYDGSSVETTSCSDSDYY